MNLIKELGYDYFQERCKRSMFFDENGKSCILMEGSGGRGSVPIAVVSGTPEKPEATAGVKPFDFFKDLSVFATPPLGWRMAAEGRLLVHFRRNNRAYHRGVAPHVLSKTYSPSTEFLMMSGNLSSSHYNNDYATTQLIMNPVYMRLREGVEAIKRGDVFSFAASPTVAVVPDVNQQLAIYFNTTKAGVVRANDSIHSDSPAIMDILKELA